MLRMRRAARDGAAPPALDEVQQRAVESAERALIVRGAPGTGKSVLAVDMVAAAVANGVAAEHCLVLSPTRRAAAHLRDRITDRLGGTTSEPLSRSHQALGFGLLRQAAALRGDPPPRLLSGPEQDVVLKDLLAGYVDGSAPAPPWPSEVREALPTRGFRAELRDLLMRAVEWGLEADDLRRLGEQHARPEWVAAADVLTDYDQVTAFSRPGAYDPAWILGAAADQLEDDSAALARVRETARFVVVDDAQELTHAAARLLSVVVGPHTQVRLLLDADSSVQGFRGADPARADELGRRWGAAEPLILPLSHRQPHALREVAERVTARIGAVGGAAHRNIEARPGGVIEVALVRAVAQEAQHIAGELRRAHLLDGVAWSDMAVIVRGQGRTSPLRRALGAAGVPVALAPATVPLREEPAVRPFLAALELVLDEAVTAETPPVPDVAVDLLTSSIGAADAVALRHLRRELRRVEIEAGGTRNSDELVAAAVVSDPATFTLYGSEVAPAARVAAVMAAGRAARAADDATAETVLWAMWEASGLADPWQRRALDGGTSGARADRDLDAVVQLFGAAAAYVDRLPGVGPEGFLEHVRSLDVAGDSLIARAPDDEAVALLTPASAAGREWHTVVVAGVQEGVWPDLRLRGSLLRSEQLVDVLTGRDSSLRSAQAAVRYDETRQFLVAVSRARERLIVTAVRSEDEQPSPYLDVVDPLELQADSDDHLEILRPFTDVRRPMSLAAVVADLRRTLATPDPTGTVHDRAARDLARLAKDGVTGADPASWWALTELSDDRPLRRDDQHVRVSPSKIDSFLSCGLNWLLTSRGGQGPDVGAASVGQLIHEIAAEFGDTNPGAMHDALDERWVRLGLGSSWVSDRKRAEAHEMIGKLRTYLDQAKAAEWQPIGIERGFSVRYDRATLAGQVDRLEQHPEHGIRVVDLKTSSSPVPKDEIAEHPQLAAYQVAVVEGAFDEGRDVAGAQLVQLRVNKNVGIQAQDSIEGADSWAHDMVADAANGMAGATVLAVIGSRCRVCPVKRCCPLHTEGRVL